MKKETDFVALTFMNDVDQTNGILKDYSSKQEWLDECVPHGININYSYLINRTGLNKTPFLEYWSPKEGNKIISHHLIGDPSVVYKLVKVIEMSQPDIEMLNMIESLVQDLKAKEIVRIAKWLLDKYENWEN